MNTKKIDTMLINVADMALKRRARYIVENIDVQNSDVILDAGCGDGYYLHLLHSYNKNALFIGSDFDERALQSAERNFKSNHIKVSWLKPNAGSKVDVKTLKKGVVYLCQADLMKSLPFKNNVFTKIVLGEVAEHLPSDTKGLKELHRVMKKNATIVITVPNQNYSFLWDPINWVLERTAKTHVKDGFFAGLWYDHIRLYRPNEIEKVTKKAGFKVEKIIAHTYWALPFNHHIINLGARLLYGGKLSESVVKSVSKYKKSTKKPLLIQLFFFIVNTVDSLNNFYTPKDMGAGVFVKAKK